MRSSGMSSATSNMSQRAQGNSDYGHKLAESFKKEAVNHADLIDEQYSIFLDPSPASSPASDIHEMIRAHS